MDKLKMHSMNKVNANVAKIAAMFPNCVTERMNEEGVCEMVVDFDMLKQELSSVIVEGAEERYQFTWPDKKKAVLAANAPIRRTLRPCRDESVEFDSTENLYIEGDNLEVLKLLQETYLGKIKMIYIDPPYNTGNDFVYNDNFTEDADEYFANSGQIDSDGNRLVTNPESNGRFHTDWLNMIYPRLKIAKDLLADDGSIFISIDNNEIDNLKKICDEIFGSSCFVDCITWNKRVPKNDNKGIGNIHEYILVYNKSITSCRQYTMLKDGLQDIYELLDSMKKRKVPIEEAEKELKALYNKKGYDRGITLYCNLDDNYEPWGKINMSWPNAETFGPRYDVLHPATKKPTKVPDRGWRWNESTFMSQLNYQRVVKRYDGSYVCGNIWFAKDENTQPSSIKYLRDVGKMLLRSIVSLKSDGGIEVEKIFDGKSYFSYPKPVSLLRLLINSIDESEGIFLDFFSGSATTAHAIMQLNAEDGGNRKFIMVQLPETTDEKSEAYKAGYKNICEIGKERIRRAGESIKQGSPLTTQGIDTGFRVLKCDSSNMKEVYYNPAELEISLLSDLSDNIKEDRTSEDLLFQVMLDLGILLSSKIEKTEIAGKTVYCVDGNKLIACFDRNVFFIDEVAKYRQYDENGDEVLGEYGEMFEQEYISVLNDYITMFDTPYQKYLKTTCADVSKVHRGYFSIDKKTGRSVDSQLKRGSEFSDDISAYDLILKNKERLLSFEEPTRFIFSHSALREGWDNPNVFQICTLKHSDSQTAKRQEVGRGLRLCVNQSGNRMDAETCGDTVHDINMLTVIASESYKTFVTDLQSDIKTVLYDRPTTATSEYFKGKYVKVNDVPTLIDKNQADAIEFYLIANGYVDMKRRVTDKYRTDVQMNTVAPLPEELQPMTEGIHTLIQSVYDDSMIEKMITDGHETKVKDNPLNENFAKKEFQALWKQINHQYAYTVEFDSEELIAKAIAHINEKLFVSELQYTTSVGRQKAEMNEHEVGRGDSFGSVKTRTQTLKHAETSQIKYDLIGKVAEGTTLTRKTAARILQGLRLDKFYMFKNNPEEFISKVIKLINEQKATMIVDHISYDQLEGTYANDIFTAEKNSQSIEKAFHAKKAIQDYVFTDGTAEDSVEKKFATDLEAADEVCVYAKLPKGFHIPTPVGNYSPDWAIAFKDGTVKHIFFVAETKGTMESLNLRPIEQAKIKCAKKLFNEISTESVRYEAVDSYQRLLQVMNSID